MADYRATSAEFTAVADAIRTKGGTSAQLTWPNGFVSAVQAIPSGGGGGSYESASLFRWYLTQTQSTTSWWIMKKLTGEVIGANLDARDSSIILAGQLVDILCNPASATVTVTAKEAISMKVYRTGRTLDAVTPTEYQMAINDTQQLTLDNLYGGLYIEAYAES